MKEKNPWLGGFLNLLLPGLGRFYAEDRMGGCLTMITFPLAVGALAVFVLPLVVAMVVDATGGNSADIAESTMQIIAGFVVFLLWLTLFPGGYLFVKRYNKKLAASVPELRGPLEQDQPEAKLKKLQEMLNAGLITQEDYEVKKAEILSRM
ncbi:MAG: SHOCT domain-containing protein [Chloroflexota bacterium]